MSKSRKTYQDRLLDMVDTLRGQIGDGTYAPGMFLPGEKTLAETFSLSTNSVAKGLDRLAEEGLVEKIRRVGCKVVKKVTVRFGIHRKMDRDLGLQWMLGEFRRRYPHIEVATVPIQDSYESDNMAEPLLKSGQFDVLLMNHIYYQDMREKDRLDLLQPLPPQEGVYPFIAERFGKEGGTAVRLIAFSPVVLAYNKKHFEEAGLPEPDSSWGWPELFDYSARLSSPPDRYGFYFNVQSVHNRWPLLLIQQMARRGTGQRPEAEDVMAAFRFLRDCLHAPGTVPGVISQQAGLAMFRTGRVSMMAMTYFMLNEMMEEPSLLCDIAPMPYWTEPRTLLIWQGVGVYRHSPVLDEAVRLADFLGSETAQQLLRDHTTSIPAYGKALRAPNGAKRRYPERFALFREIIPSYREPNDCGLTNRELGKLHQLAMLYASGVIREEEVQEQVRQMI